MNTTLTEIKPITYPARPVDCGPFDLALPKSGEYRFEPKGNGWRLLLNVPTGTMFNRHGNRLSIASEFESALEKLQELDRQVCHMEWLDCEALERRHGYGRGTLIVLDLIDEASKPYDVRRELMADLFEEAPLSPIGYPTDGVLIFPQVAGDMESWRQLQQINSDCDAPFWEGFVAKKASSFYPVQLRSPDVKCHHWQKHRFPF